MLKFPFGDNQRAGRETFPGWRLGSILASKCAFALRLQSHVSCKGDPCGWVLLEGAVEGVGWPRCASSWPGYGWDYFTSLLTHICPEAFSTVCLGDLKDRRRRLPPLAGTWIFGVL